MKQELRKRAQAMIELAILAPLLLTCVGLIVTYVCKLNNDQWTLMQAFRNALAKSHSENKIISYGTWDDRRMASVTTPILGEKTTSSGSACINWFIGDVNEQDEDAKDKTYVKVNGGIWSIPFYNEYDLGSGGSGGIEPIYMTTKGSSATVSSNDNAVASSRSGGVGEFMIYKINKRNYFQGRGHGASRGY